ncbi:hypothetical protein BKA69DRAFT_624892 [Paraphysoderma sedebokerense]|nr:hypothetical protein BKA69DRAFT_624892 [Paraphysoderma sedebokerense]
MRKFAITSLLVFFAAIVFSDSTIMAADVGCICSQVEQQNLCFCGPEGEKINSCIKPIAPNWPFEEKPNSANTNCPNPVEDPTGFSSCIAAKAPKPLSNANQIFETCRTQTKAVPQNGRPSNDPNNNGNISNVGNNNGRTTVSSGTAATTPTPVNDGSKAGNQKTSGGFTNANTMMPLGIVGVAAIAVIVL